MSFSAKLVGPLRKTVSEVSTKVNNSGSWYRPLLKSAFASAWKSKFLWFFGFFAAIIGSGSELLAIYDSFNRSQEQGSLYDTLRALVFSDSIKLRGVLETIVAPEARGLLIAAGLLVAILLFFVFLAVVSQGALIHSGTKTEAAGVSSWSEAWKAGVANFWKLFALNLGGKVLFGIAYVLFALPILFLYSGNSSGLLQVLLVLLAFLVIVPLVLLISLFVRLTAIAVVSRSTSINEGFREARKLFVRYWLVIVEFVVLLFLVDVATFVVLRLGMAVLALPFLFAISLFYAFVIPIGASLFYILWIVASLVFVLFIAAYMSTFQYLAWVKLYHALLEGSLTSKLVRWVLKLTGSTPKS